MPPLVFLLATAVFAQGTSEFLLAGLLPDIAADLDTTVPSAGLLTSAFAVGMVVGAPTMAVATRRLPPRLALTAFLVVFIAMHVIGATTTSYAVLFVSRIVAAFANAGFLAVTLATVTALVTPDRISRAVAMILAGTTLALVLGVPAGTLVGTLLDWRAALWAIALLSAPALIAVAIAAPDRRTHRADISLTTECTALRNRSLIRVLALCALINGATFCSFTYLAPIVTERTELRPASVPLVLALFGAGALCGVWAAGKYADRYASRIVSVGGLALLGGWCCFGLLAQLPTAVLLLAFVQGGLSFALGSTLVGQVMRTAVHAPTMSGSFATASLNVGAAAGPALGGWAYGSTLGTVGPLAVSAALVAVALILTRS
ncbi:MAG: Cmx/CmrA family chloramphenicol efflux MFS transporter [Rhodococcus sp. (in: high G+C Gram-positive bacteria)]|uniref:Cmx/CmrA family chloramphenicol efflux MFS transporter n=1 Tax=Rhodococcus sp. SBT000017 TaxID=1803385 RepID=UPI000EF88BB5|nr:Cmx/CmrA family chloramphenicol efflux MFS transporter [Rhodococcus sp. SBT000017]RMB77921.1 MFS transporter [Rhodococcus sp. SBT000017]